MLKIQTLDRPEVFLSGLQLGWLVGHLEKWTLLDGGITRCYETIVNRDHDMKRRIVGRRVQGFGRSMGSVLNLMPSEGIRPHQDSTVIHGHLVSINKPNILLWKRMELNHIVQERELQHTHQLSCQFWGMTLEFCFILFLQEHHNHSFVCPHLCVRIFPVNIFLISHSLVFPIGLLSPVDYG